MFGAEFFPRAGSIQVLVIVSGGCRKGEIQPRDTDLHSSAWAGESLQGRAQGAGPKAGSVRGGGALHDRETSGQEVKGQDPPGGEGSARGGRGGLPFAESLLGPPQVTHVPTELTLAEAPSPVFRRGTGTKKNLRTRITQLGSGRTRIQIWIFSCQRPLVLSTDPRDLGCEDGDHIFEDLWLRPRSKVRVA